MTVIRGMVTVAAMLAGIGLAPILGSAEVPTRSVQQDFDAATTLDAGTDNAAALAAWHALEQRVRPGSRSAAIVAVRKGDALFRLARLEEANAALRTGLAGLPTADTSLRADRARAWLLVGTLAQSTLDYAGAAQAFTEAEAASDTPSGKLQAQLALAQVETFVDPGAAARALVRADAELAALPKTEPAVVALVARRRAELLMNTGELANARVQALAAVRLLGGLTAKTSLADVAVRADAALAYILDKKPELAREYMAMTGAGRLPKGDFRPAQQMQAPECGGEAGLKPDDVAVVQFGIGDNGAVTQVEPIYAAGGGRVAIEFARAVRGWSWSPEEVQTIPPFFRYNVRVEMRCSTAFARPSVGDGLNDRLIAWLTDKDIAVQRMADAGTPALAVARRADFIAANAADPQSPATLAAAWTLAQFATVPREEKAALLQQALRIARASGAPALASLALDLPARTATLVDAWKPGAFEAIAASMLTDPAYAGDPQARAAIQLIRSDYLPKRTARDQAIIALLTPVIADPKLEKDDPLRVGALVRIASAEQRRGNLVGARSAFAATGLAADQCAVIDARPRVTDFPGSEAFPREAMMWGFEGWSQVQSDVGADGRPAAARTLLSYPAFVFSTAARDAAAQMRYEKTFRPDGALGCGGLMHRIVFKLPG